MFHKIADVHTAVFRYFSESLQKDLGVHVRYARKSSHDYTEEQKQQIYPCVAIQDYYPVPKENWWIEHMPFHRANSLDGTEAYLYYLPMWMEFRYDVSVASKSYTEYMRIQQWFLDNVVAMDEIVLEPIIIGDMDAGEPIPLAVRVQDIPRTDGVYETNYEVTFDIWLYSRSPISVPAIQEVVIRLSRIKESQPPLPKRLASFDPLSFDEGFAITPEESGGTERDPDFCIFSYGEHNRCIPNARLTDYLARTLLEVDGYSGIRDITLEEYMELPERDPDMIYIIQ